MVARISMPFDHAHFISSDLSTVHTEVDPNNRRVSMPDFIVYLGRSDIPNLDVLACFVAWDLAA